MNFQGLEKIDKPDFYIDVAIKRSKTHADEIRSGLPSKKTRLEKSKIIELEKMRVLNKTLGDALNRITKSYPSLEELDEFYKQLINLFLDINALKKALGAVGWAVKKSNTLTTDYARKIKSCRDVESTVKIAREFLGRFASVPKQIKGELGYLELARKIMRNFPSIKTGMKTISIAGFPNVGKSTLLSKITTSTPEISNYAFTTKQLNVGYLKKGYLKIQFIDTPGTLNRMEKMNDIEKQAYMAMKYASDEIIYVFDLTETYPVKDQIKLYKSIKELYKPTHVYLSKTDIIDKKIVEEFKSEHKTYNYLDFEEILNMKS